MGGFASFLGGASGPLQAYGQQQREIVQQTKMELARQIGEMLKTVPYDSADFAEGVRHLNAVLNAKTGIDANPSSAQSVAQKALGWLRPHPQVQQGALHIIGVQPPSPAPPGPAAPGNTPGTQQVQQQGSPWVIPPRQPMQNLWTPEAVTPTSVDSGMVPEPDEDTGIKEFSGRLTPPPSGLGDLARTASVTPPAAQPSTTAVPTKAEPIKTSPLQTQIATPNAPPVEATPTQAQLPSFMTQQDINNTGITGKSKLGDMLGIHTPYGTPPPSWGAPARVPIPGLNTNGGGFEQGTQAGGLTPFDPYMYVPPQLAHLKGSPSPGAIAALNPYVQQAVTNRAQLEQKMQFAQYEIGQRQAALRELQASPDWGKLPPQIRSEWKIWASTPSAQIPAMSAAYFRPVRVNPTVPASTVNPADLIDAAGQPINPKTSPFVSRNFDPMTQTYFYESTNGPIEAVAGANGIENVAKTPGPVTVSGGGPAQPLSTLTNPQQRFIAEYQRIHPGATIGQAETAFKQIMPPQRTLVMIPDQSGGYQAKEVRGGSSIPADAHTMSGVNTLNTPTAATRSRGEMSATVVEQVPQINAQIDALKSKLGPAAGRWNELWVNKAGMNDPAFAKLDQDLDLYASALSVAHFGKSGGQKYRDLLSKRFGEAQSPEDLKARIASADSWLQGYVNASKGNSGAGIQPIGASKPIVQHSASTGQYRYSTDGGKTWHAGQPQ